MESQNNFLTLEEIIELLQNEKTNYDSCTLKNRLKIENLLNELTITAISLIGTDLEDVVLLGNDVEVKLEYNDGDVDYARFNLCMDFHDECVSILSPLGSSVFGAKVGESVLYEVDNNFG